MCHDAVEFRIDQAYLIIPIAADDLKDTLCIHHAHPVIIVGMGVFWATVICVNHCKGVVLSSIEGVKVDSPPPPAVWQ